MKRPLFIARQAGNPTGVLGRTLARIMERETAALNDRAIECLELEPSDHVLEIGFGHGRSVERIAAAVPRGAVAGIDVSEEMTRLAARRNRRAVSEGRVDLRTGDSADLPYDAATFDKALTVHTLYFWPDPNVCLREIRRVLRPGGRLVLVATRKQSSHSQDFPSEVYTFHDDSELERMLAAANFASTALHAVGDVSIAVATA